MSEKELRNAIVKACRALAAHGLVAATDGNVTARLGAERFLATPSGLSKAEIEAADLILCDAAGRKLRGKHDLTSELKVHLSAYENRPEIGAVIHAHPPTATAFTFAGREHLFRQNIVPEVIAQIGPIPTVPYATPSTRALADGFAQAIKRCDVVMLAQHGAVTVAKTPWSAYLRMEKLEQFATILKTTLELCGGKETRIRRLTPRQVEELLASYGKK